MVWFLGIGISYFLILKVECWFCFIHFWIEMSHTLAIKIKFILQFGTSLLSWNPIMPKISTAYIQFKFLYGHVSDIWYSYFILLKNTVALFFVRVVSNLVCCRCIKSLSSNNIYRNIHTIRILDIKLYIYLLFNLSYHMLVEQLLQYYTTLHCIC